VHDATETSWEDHGFVRVKDSNGKTLVESNDFQHNPFARNCEQRVAALMEQIPPQALASEKEPTSESEGSTKAASDGDA